MCGSFEMALYIVEPFLNNETLINEGDIHVTE